MITRDEISRKDFSIVLPILIDKLETIYELIFPEGKNIPDNAARGIATIVQEVADDLKTIANVLYGSSND